MRCLDGSNNVKVYNLTASKNVPQWLSNKKQKRKSKKDNDDLLQDFDMPDVSTCINQSPDGQYLMACGTYKPVMKCYDLADLSVKFERGMDAEVINFQILSEDYSKIAFLQEERYIELHGQGGKVWRKRVPRFGRDLTLHYPSADLYIAASGKEIYRLNLFQGRFLTPIDAETSGVNRLVCNPYHGLLQCGTDDGVLQCWDPRARRRVGTLDSGRHMMDYAQSIDEQIKSGKDLRITSLAMDGPFTLGVGNQTGQVLLYDIRCNSPYLVRDHHMRTPIRAIHFHSSGNVFSMAAGVVKIWDKTTGTAVTSIEGETPFNDMSVVPGTGLSFFASEDKQMKAYFVPSLGPAPAWCAHLDAMTEEMEEDEATEGTSQYDDYVFVTMDNLIELGLKDLVGTSMVRAKMHGYEINRATYNKAKQLANPVKPVNVVKKKLKETIKERNTHRIKQKKVSASINKTLLLKVQEQDPQAASDLLTDDRFSKMFTSASFRHDDKVQDSVASFSNISAKKSKKDAAFKKRREQVEREEREEFQPEAAVDDGEVSDTDSIVDGAAMKRGGKEESSDEEREEQKRTLFKRRKIGGRGGRRTHS